MNVLLLFRSTREVIKAEAICRAAGLPGQVVAVPKDVSAECGMSVALDEPAAAQATRLLADAGIPTHVHRPTPHFDLLSTVEQGGCSAKLPLDLLLAAIRDLPTSSDPNLMVGIDTCDDAGVYRLSEDVALIQTTDFFPPRMLRPLRVRSDCRRQRPERRLRHGRTGADRDEPGHVPGQGHPDGRPARDPAWRPGQDR